jgi:hypothetical protein
LKPYWNEGLTASRKHKKATRREWIKAGKPRGNSDTFKRLKEAKHSFKVCQREAEKQYELNNMQEICKTQQIDQKYFWYLVNRYKRKGNTTHPIKLENGNIISDSDDIRDQWKVYLEKLYTPQSREEYDEEFKVHVEHSLLDMACESYNNDDKCMNNPISTEEVRELCKNLKRRKHLGGIL